MSYLVIYDGLCNLCTTLVQGLEQLEGGVQFRYVPMQDTVTLAQWGITAADCEQGMILVDLNNPQVRWQGSAAAEEIARQFPGGQPLIQAYRGLPGLKATGDQVYTQVRDNRYAWFGKRSQTYFSRYPYHCDNCKVENPSDSPGATDQKTPDGNKS